MKYELKNGWSAIDKEEKAKIFDFCEKYKDFLNKSKTERESVNTAIAMAEECGFVPLESKSSLKAGDKVYSVNKNKALALAVIGNEDIANGIHIVGAHIDSPRLDLKQNPLFESEEMAFLKTHYYGGIKKYQWTAIPLAIHGVVAKVDGSIVSVSIGEEDDDVTFVITDLLPHLASDQMSKSANAFIEGENLNLLIGSIPCEDKDAKEKVKENILSVLKEKYDIDEEDFTSAELEIVPAYKAKDLGFDRSLIASYAHDDRVCSFDALSAICSTTECKKTAVCLVTDKEEVGSMGNTGAKSRFLQLFMLELMNKKGEEASELNLLRCFDKSKCLSADVASAIDPNFSSVYEKNNCGRINYGIAISKYTGARGKSGSNDSSAEMMAYLRKLFNDNNIVWHTAELGKVDAGGGGTIAQYISNLGIETIDCGVSVLSMHAPYEVVAKFDVYMTYKAFTAFLK